MAERKKEEKKPTSFVEAVIGAVAAGTLGEGAKQKIADIMNGDASFISWWQRQTGESVISARNVIKAVALLAAYVAYQHLDPFPDSPIDNAAALLTAVVLGALLIIPQSTELGAHFKTLEARILVAFKNDLAELGNVLAWIRALSNRQEGRVAALVRGLEVVHGGAEDKINESVRDFLGTEEKRNRLKGLIGEDPKPADIGKWVKENWPPLNKKIGSTIKPFNDRIESFLRQRRQKAGRRQKNYRPEEIKLLTWRGTK